MSNYPAESFYRGTIRQSLSNVVTCPCVVKVSKIPKLTAWLLTISPNTSNEEIVEYDGVDSINLTITIVKRGINPATQSLTRSGVDYDNTSFQFNHSQNNSIRGDVTHLHIIQDYGNLVANKLDKSGGLRDTMPANWAFVTDTSGNESVLVWGWFLPSGGIVPFAWASSPVWFLLCDWAIVSRTTYSNLFSVIGTTYWVGDGTTTFAIPNMKGRVVVGFDTTQTEFDALGEVGGAKTHTLSEAEMPSHKHKVVTVSRGVLKLE